MHVVPFAVTPMIVVNCRVSVDSGRVRIVRISLTDPLASNRDFGGEGILALANQSLTCERFAGSVLASRKPYERRYSYEDPLSHP